MDDHDYVGDSKDDLDQRRLRFNRRGIAHRWPRREVQNNDDSFGKIKFTIPAFDEAAEKPAKSASSVASTSRTRDVQCHRCKDFWHMQRDCPSKRVLIVKDDGDYSSASDFDEDTLALLAANNIDSEDEEHIKADVADQYESLIVQRVLSAQMGKAEQNQWHNLFQTKCVVSKRSCRTIINGGSCRNLVSTEMVTKLALQMKPHPHPYYK
uniref:Retrotransposon protein, putative, Ty3-gypsy subclass n=1 Tax=Oryza sativa subsp. japonica TaxID=39947 RepID=Q2QT86_ORYSJ|nr:retrotransposon protein, putative, Ty3-gypsy subclass [Oryza sativa Japonica Group]